MDKSSTEELTPPAADSTTAPRRSLGRRFLRALVGVCLILVTAEFLLRFLLFSDIAAVQRIAAPLRHQDNFASMRDDDLWWKLHWIFNDPKKRKDIVTPEPSVGWVNSRTTAMTFAHSDEDQIGERRPVLLFGDSYADCIASVTGDQCWEDLLEESELSSEMALLNYGTGGYGFDQIVLSMLSTIDRFEDKNPIVIISVMVDGDLDRSSLRFRGWPKAHFALKEDGSLELDSGSLPPSTVDYIEQHPPQCFSYLLRWYLFSSGRWQPNEASEFLRGGTMMEEKRELNRRLFELAIETCESRGLDYFFLLFNARLAVAWPPKPGWPTSFAVDTLEELGAPYVTANSALLEEMGNSSEPLTNFFIMKGRGRNHYNVRGNRTVFRAIERGLRKQFKESSGAFMPMWKMRNASSEGTAVMEKGIVPLYSDPEDERRLVFTAEPTKPTALVFNLAGRATRFRTLLKLLPATPDTPKGLLNLSIELDGERVFSKTCAPGVRPSGIDLDLSGVQEMVIIVGRRQEKKLGTGLYLASPTVEWAGDDPADSGDRDDIGK